MNNYEKAWLIWFFLALAGFFALEILAIKNENYEGTLSHATRRALGMKKSTFHKVIGATGLSTFFSWFVIHVSTGRLTPNFMKLTPRE